MWVLVFLRTTAYFCLFLLLLGPSVLFSEQMLQKREVVIAVDNSGSVARMADTVRIGEQVLSLTRELEAIDLAVQHENLGGPFRPADLRFDGLSSNLQNLLEASLGSGSGDPGAIIVVSDGIVNQGSLLSQLTSPVPVFAVGVGDTTQVRDVRIHRIVSNPIAYRGEDFQAHVYIRTQGYARSELEVRILREGRVEASRRVGSVGDGDSEIKFRMSAEEPGMARYRVEVEPLEGETRVANNSEDFFVDVLEGKYRVLVAGGMPHPDIRALRTAVESSDRFETFLYIPGLFRKLAPQDTYDVVILHQAGTSLVDPIAVKGDPSYFFVAPDLATLRDSYSLTGVGVSPGKGQFDEVRGVYNRKFSGFDLDPSLVEMLEVYPQTTVPYGDYSQDPRVETLLYQGVGSAATSRPLFTFMDSPGGRTALFLGGDIWRWRLVSSKVDPTGGFDDLIRRTLEYLVARTYQRRLLVRPEKASFLQGDRIRFRAQTFDASYRSVGGVSIELNTRAEDGTSQDYDFITSTSNPYLDAGVLDPGVYTFRASGVVDGLTFLEEGEFAVHPFERELSQLRANHRALQDFSERSRGRFYRQEQMGELVESIRELSLEGITHTESRMVPILHLWWFMLIPLLCLGTEWVLAKYHGY